MTMGSVRRSTEWMCAIGLAVALGACGGDKGSAPPPRVPARLVVVSGVDQEIPVTAAAAAPVVARVETADGRPVPGVTVTWTTTAGSVSPTTSVSASDGTVQTVPTAGQSAVFFGVQGTVTGLPPAVFRERAVAGPATEVVLSADSLQLFGESDTARVVIAMRDVFGNVVQPRAARWSSSDTLVATVDSTGLVRARGTGSTTIEIAAGEQRRAVIVRVRNPFAPDLAMTVSGVVGTGLPAVLSFTARGSGGIPGAVQLSVRWDPSRLRAEALAPGSVVPVAYIDNAQGLLRAVIAAPMGLLPVVQVAGLRFVPLRSGAADITITTDRLVSATSFAELTPRAPVLTRVVVQ